MNDAIARNDLRIGYHHNYRTGTGHHQATCIQCPWTGKRWTTWQQAATELRTHLTDQHGQGLPDDDQDEDP
jgi:hypothetical protein